MRLGYTADEAIEREEGPPAGAVGIYQDGEDDSETDGEEGDEDEDWGGEGPGVHDMDDDGHSEEDGDSDDEEGGDSDGEDSEGEDLGGFGHAGLHGIGRGVGRGRGRGQARGRGRGRYAHVCERMYLMFINLLPLPYLLDDSNTDECCINYSHNCQRVRRCWFRPERGSR